MKMTITGQIDGKSVPITIPIEKVIEAFWPYASKPSALSVSTELDADGISANFMLGQETKDSYPGIWLTSKNSNTGRAGFWFCLELPNETNDMVKGYRLWDKVSCNGTECFITGRRTSGYFALKKLDGTVISNSISYKKLRLLEVATNYITEISNNKEEKLL